MIFSDRQIEKMHKEVIENPNRRAWMYRALVNGAELTEGCVKTTSNGVTWEGKVFMGMDLVEAMKDGWQDDFYVSKPVETTDGADAHLGNDPEKAPDPIPEPVKQEKVHVLPPSIKEDVKESPPAVTKQVKPGKLRKKRKYLRS